MQLSYFDVERGVYETAATDPLTVEVTGDAVDVPVVAGRRRGIQPLREDIRFIHIRQPSFRPIDRSLANSPGFWVVLLVPLAAVGGAVGVRRHRDRLRGDVAYARHRRASRVAKKRLARARSLAGPETQRNFYAETARALQGFLGDKLNISETGMVHDDVQKRLRGRGLSEDAIAAYFDCLAVCDRQRFAPSAADAGEMQGFLGRVERAMVGLDRGLEA